MKKLAPLAAALLTGALAQAGQPPAERAGEDAKPNDAPRNAPRQRQPDTRRQNLLQAILYKKLTVNFQRTPAREVFDFIRTALGVELQVHYAGDGGAAGIDPDLPITLEAREAHAIEVLELVLEQCSSVDECTWQVRRATLEVGTKERLSVPAAREIRWYPVDEMVFEAPRFTDAIDLRLDHAYPWNGAFGWGYPNTWMGGGGYGGSIKVAPAPAGGSAGAQRGESLVDLIVTVVEPSAWARNGGDRASIAYRDGVLIVNAPDYIQRQIFGYPRVPPPPPPPSEASEGAGQTSAEPAP